MCGIWCPGGFSSNGIHVRAETKLLLQSQAITVDWQMRGTMSHDRLSSTEWIGALVALVGLRLFSDPSLQTWCEPVASNQSDPDNASHTGCGGPSSHWRRRSA
jgi:hypothetical protein